MRKRIPAVMTIAGSDSGAGAGIQADLKTFAALGVYGVSVITAVTAQNTQGVTAIEDVSISLIEAQIDAVVGDFGVETAKTGMLSNSAILRSVALKIREIRLKNLVVDPVMVAKGGDRLLEADAVEILRTELLPLAQVVTPNIYETEVLTRRQIDSLDDVRLAARDILAMGARSVVVKGGHLPGDAVDVYYDGREFQEFRVSRVETGSTHGTGCTFASAIAAGLGQGLSHVESIALAKKYVTEALRKAFPIGQGHGPLNHFFRLWE